MSVIRGVDKQGTYVVTFSETTIRDEAKIAQFGSEFESLLARAYQKRLLVDFSGVTFMSSSMMGQFVLLSRQCKAAGVALKFCGICPSVMEIFNIMKLNKVFSIYKDEQTALKAFYKKGWFG